MDLSRPESRGFVRLRSADPADAPSIVFNHMESRQDMQDMIDGIRLTRTLVSQSAWDEYRREELAPGPDVTSDSEIEAFVRQATGTSYHPSGTCRMGVDPDAVVDGDGQVRRVRRLRVVDASIMPKVITGNLNAPVMMMAEKISDRIRGTALPPLTGTGLIACRSSPSCLSSAASRRTRFVNRSRLVIVPWNSGVLLPSPVSGTQVRPTHEPHGDPDRWSISLRSCPVGRRDRRQSHWGPTEPA